MNTFAPYITTSIVSTLFFALSIFVWKSSYAYSSWAFLCLLPIGFATVLSVTQDAIDLRKCILASTLKESSPLYTLFSAKIFPFLAGCVVSAFLLPIIAYHTLLADPLESFCLLLVYFAAGLTYTAVFSTLKSQISDLALWWYARTTSVLLVSAISFLPYAYFEWRFVSRPGYLRADLSEAIRSSLEQLPQRGDFFNEVASFYLVFETAALWIVSISSDMISPGFLYALHSALICYVIASCSTAVTSFYRRNVEGRIKLNLSI